MSRTPEVGGLPVVTLTAGAGDGIVEAHIAPGRGMMLLGARGRMPGGDLVDLIEAPPLAQVQAHLDASPDDFAGNASFGFGGAILLPFANRIRGRSLPARRAILADLGMAPARLPRNWGGKAPGAAQYAMHGLLLDLAVPEVEQPSADLVRGRVANWDFSGCWPSRVDLDLTWRLAAGGLELCVDATNVGDQVLPMGIGWHPYFRVLSGRRDQVRLHLPGRLRAKVTNYDEVLPTGEIEPVAGTPFDFNAREGRALAELHLDDCLLDLARDREGRMTVRILDPAAACEVRLTSATAQIRAVQVYAPPERPVVVVEPQFNLADPFWTGWPQGLDTGMAMLAPGQSVAYRMRTDFRPYLAS